MDWTPDFTGTRPIESLVPAKERQRGYFTNDVLRVDALGYSRVTLSATAHHTMLTFRVVYYNRVHRY